MEVPRHRGHPGRERRRTRPGKDGTQMIMTIVDFIEVAGSLLILSAFAASQRGVLDIRSRLYLTLNVLGSAVLAVIAMLHRSWGFLLLEGTWAVVSAASLVAMLHRAGSGGGGGGGPVVPPPAPPTPSDVAPPDVAHPGRGSGTSGGGRSDRP
jgi:hypothetical protein